jgi:hypothetical protein
MVCLAAVCAALPLNLVFRSIAPKRQISNFLFFMYVSLLVHFSHLQLFSNALKPTVSLLIFRIQGGDASEGSCAVDVPDASFVLFACLFFCRVCRSAQGGGVYGQSGHH